MPGIFSLTIVAALGQTRQTMACSCWEIISLGGLIHFAAVTSKIFSSCSDDKAQAKSLALRIDFIP